MKSITFLIVVSLIFISQICGHKIHKRLLETSKEPPNNGINLLNTTNLENTTSTTMASSQIMLKEPETIVVNSMQNWSLISATEAPEILVHPYVEATEVHQFNESDFKSFLEGPTDEKLHTEKPLEASDKNSFSPGETLSSLSISRQPLQIFKENCSCFSVRRPNSMKNSQKFENSTTSIMSEVESEIGILFEIAAGVLPKMNDFIGTRNANATSANTSQAAEANSNSSEIIVLKNDEPPFFEDFVPFFPLESLLGMRAMPQETIIIQSEAVDGSKSFPKMSDDFIQNGTDLIKKEPNSTTHKNDKVDDKKPILA